MHSFFWGGEGKGKGGGGDEVKELPPPLTGPTELGTMLHATCVEYEKKWATMDEEDNFAQKYDPGMVKAIVRPKVYEDMRKVVDTMLIDQLKNLQTQLEGRRRPERRERKGRRGRKGRRARRGRRGRKGRKGRKGRGRASCREKSTAKT